MSDLQGEFVERYAERGPKGAKGDKGDVGEPSTRLPVPQARAVVFLFVFSVLVSLVCLAGLAYYGHELSGQQQAVTRQQQAVARAQREFLAAQHASNQDQCETIRQFASNPPAAGPARRWETQFEAIERNRLRQLGCAP